MSGETLARVRFWFWTVLAVAGTGAFLSAAPFGLVTLMFGVIVGLGVAMAPLTIVILFLSRRHDARHLCRLCGHTLGSDAMHCAACGAVVPPELRQARATNAAGVGGVSVRG